ncbi:MAG TPA: hypothetical protein VMX16_03305 [Terriglobia bacterium]|nr:hypothetical protein [Terriglobia bacterium]
MAFKKLVVGAAALFFFLQAGRAVASVSNVYISQSGGGNGSSCSSPLAVSYFNTAGNWTSGTPTGTQIGPGTTVHLCGTFTSALTAQGSGASGSPITIFFESGAKISMGSCGSTGCINIASLSYVTIDGGANGIIEATNSGTGLGSSDSIGVYGRSGISHCEIKNLTINNLYVHTGASDNAAGNYYAIWLDGTNNLVHNNTIKDALAGIKVEAPSSGNSFYDNVIHNINWGIFESGSASVNSITNEKIYGNEVYDFANWDTTADTFHHDGLFLSGSSATTDLTHVDVYSNYVHGTSSSAVTCASASGSCLTAYIYINTDSNVRVFNNLLVANSGDTGPNNGWILMYADASDSLYNNTVIGGTVSGNSNCAVLDSGISFSFENNVLSNCNNLLWSNSATFATINYNVYQSSALSWRIGSSWYSTLAAWKSAVGGDASAQATTGSLNLDANFKPFSTSLAVGTGANLTSLGVTALDSDKSGIARPTSGTWDAGAYQVASTSAVNPPTALTAQAY